MCIPKIAFMGAVVKISYEKNDFCHFSVKKWTGRGTVELLKMGYVTFFYQNPFYTLIDASLKWAQHQIN